MTLSDSDERLNLGDYDGDRVSIFFQPELLDGFKPSDPKFADPPHSVEEALTKSGEPVEQFLQRCPVTLPREERIAALQDYLLGDIQGASLVGVYSTYWLTSVYTKGYDHDYTVKLAYM